jgi:hypothetical protein
MMYCLYLYILISYVIMEKVAASFFYRFFELSIPDGWLVRDDSLCLQFSVFRSHLKVSCRRGAHLKTPAGVRLCENGESN